MRVFTIVFGVALFVTSAAQAGVLTFNTNWVDSTPLSMTNTSATLDETLSNLNVQERYVAFDDSTLGCSGTTDTDPSLHITKTVLNDSSLDWTGYQIDVSGANVSYVAHSAACDAFTAISESGNHLTFSGATVAIGHSVTFDFDVTLGTGTFGLDIHQTPVPEPATLSLLGLGLMGLLRRRR